jgi:hypothetical protein
VGRSRPSTIHADRRVEAKRAAGTRLEDSPGVRLSRYLARAILALTALTALLGAPGAATAKGRSVNVFAFRPTQMEIGKAAAGFYLTGWRAEAKERGMSLKQYAEKVLKPKYAKEKIPSIIDPEGEDRNTDGHHRITALRQVSRLTGVQFNVRAEVQKDYRGYGFKKYARHFIRRLKKGEFTPEAEALGPVKRMRQLPDRYEDLIDNPMRSALEVVFSEHGISGTMMRDYVEFRLGRRLLDDGLLEELKTAGVVASGARTLPAGLATDSRVTGAIAARLRTPEMRQLMLDEALDKKMRRKLKDRLREL